MRCRIIKVGGSLLQLADLSLRFSNWLGRQDPAEQTIVVVGGGILVDQIRILDDLFDLGADSSHWLAIRAMSVTAQLFADVVNDFRLVDSLAAIDESGRFVFDTFLVLKQESDAITALPAGWHVSSDSIAAYFANRLNADELVVLKSDQYRHVSIQAAANAGFVDQHFPVIASKCAAIRFDVLQ